MYVLLAASLAGCTAAGLDAGPSAEQVSQTRDDGPVLVCTEPAVTVDGEASASSIACYPSGSGTPLL